MSQACNVVVIIDISSSMSNRGYLPFAQTDASTFINIMNIDDSLGLVKFESTANIIYPSTGDKVYKIQSQSDQNTATATVMALKGKGRTNMSAAISLGAGMLSASSAPKAMVLLSDGEWNEGTDPTKNLPGIPIYTIALGNNGQVKTLQTIAEDSGGDFHLSPTPFDLSDIYNSIVHSTGIAALLKSQQHIIPQNQFKTTNVVYSSGAQQATFAVTWSNKTIVYTPNTPTGEQINVALRGPNGNVPATATAVGSGFVVFKVPNPTPGDYTAAAWYSGTQQLHCTIGLFDPHLDLNLAASASQAIVPTGTAVHISTAVDEAGTALEDAKISVALESPTISHHEAAEQHQEALARHKGDSDENSLNVQMLKLQMERGPHNPLIPYESKTLVQGASNTSSMSFTPQVKGTHIVRVTAEGISPKTKRKYTLHKRVSVFAE